MEKINPKRSGIIAGGNFIIDHVKIIDAWPEENMLASILRESSSNGGGPYNVLKDLAAMGAPFALEAAGLIGNDANGDWILNDCRSSGIDIAQLRQTPEAPTSYTDAMTVESTGRRTFFHQRGANALLGTDDFDFSGTGARIFYLGYLMLLDRLDVIDADGGTGAARVLAAARDAGMLTCVDIVSTENARFRAIALAALPHLDYLIINEIEAGKIVAANLRRNGRIDLETVRDAARTLVEAGVGRQVVVHFEEGAHARTAEGECHEQASLNLPQEFIQGATGAGDAFAAGYLLGIHEGLGPEASLLHGVCAAAACLSHPATTQGIPRLADCLALADRFGFRELKSP